MLSYFRRKSLTPLLSRSFGGVLERPTKNLDNPNEHEYYMGLEYDYGIHNYAPLPIVIKEGKGAHVWDVKGKKYLDFITGFSVVNQGHCHPRIVNAMIEQAKKLTIASRALYNNQLGPTMKFLSETFGYERVLMANGGVESGEGAIKIARKWGYVKKGVPEKMAKNVFANNNFWGRTLAACASSNNPDRYEGFGPFDMNFIRIDFNDLAALEKVLASDPNIVSFMVEPIQGEAGIVYPQPGYLKKAQEICKKYNVLLIADEVQTGMGRTGKLLASEWDGVKPDITLLGKGLSGGFYPVSAVLGSKEVIGCIEPGTHGSTYGGNPLACVITREAINILKEEGLIENSRRLGEILHKELQEIKKLPIVHDVRSGKGLFAGLEIKEDAKVKPIDVSMKLAENGLLTKVTQKTTFRLAPALTITEKELDEALKIIKKVLKLY